MLGFIQYLIESTATSRYSDEHALARVWNHMVQKGIADNKNAMMEELAKAKVDQSHPLHFDNVSAEGFKGKKKTHEAYDSYHKELATAVDTVHALASHPDFAKAVKEKHIASVMGGNRGKVSPTWINHGATKGPVSKSDLSISDPSEEGSNKGLLLSLKKGSGSQLMSAGPEENKAVHDHAARKMLDTHPNYKNMTQAEKDKIHAKIMSHMDEVTKHLNAMKTAPRSDLEHHKIKAQASIDAAHDAHPELNNYVRKEATTGEGKFGKNTPHAVSYLVKSGFRTTKPDVIHVDKHDYEGSRPRIALPKGDGRSGNVKSDE